MKRTQRRATKITPAAVAAFEAGDDRALRRALKLRPWEWPTLADPQDDRSFFHHQEWRGRAQALYVELKALAPDAEAAPFL